MWIMYWSRCGPALCWATMLLFCLADSACPHLKPTVKWRHCSHSSVPVHTLISSTFTGVIECELDGHKSWPDKRSTMQGSSVLLSRTHTHTHTLTFPSFPPDLERQGVTLIIVVQKRFLGSQSPFACQFVSVLYCYSHPGLWLYDSYESPGPQSHWNGLQRREENKVVIEIQSLLPYQLYCGFAQRHTQTCTRRHMGTFRPTHTHTHTRIYICP